MRDIKESLGRGLAEFDVLWDSGFELRVEDLGVQGLGVLRISRFRGLGLGCRVEGSGV